MQRILFVDDDPAVLDGLRRMLWEQRLDAEAVTETSALPALNRAQQGDIDLVVSDVRMPGMDGIELLTRLRADHRTQQIPVIMLTGHADDEARRLALELGVNDFISKPANSDELAARLRNNLRLSGYQARLEKQKLILEQQLIQSQRMEIVGVLAAGILHDLRNILTTMIGRTELASNRIDENDPSQKSLRLATHAGEHAQELLEQIVRLGKPEMAHTERCALDQLVERGLKLMEVSIPKDIEVVWTNRTHDPRVQVDSTHLFQVLLNLCINAVDAMKGGGKLSVSLSEFNGEPPAAGGQHTLPSGPYIVLEVADTGQGMDTETQERIFEPFFTTKCESDGTGLGLSVVQRIIQNLGGTIRVESKPAKGSKFTLYIPQQSGAATDGMPEHEDSRAE